jgi:toxin ParE1/3/4
LSPRKKRSVKATVVLTERAVADVREIERYSLKEWGRKTADKYLDEIAAALDRIQTNPEILRLEPEFASGLYFYRIKRHFLVCDYHRETVVVVTVIHSSMDLPTRLADLEPRLVAEAEYLHRRLDDRS